MNKNLSLSGLFHKGKYTLLMALVEKGVYFLVFVYIARSTGVREYGSFVSAFAFANILNSFFEFGFGTYFQREAASRHAMIQEQFNAALGFRIMIFAAYCAITLFYCIATGVQISGMVVLISLAIYLGGISLLFSRVLYGLDLYEESFFALMKSRAIIPIGIAIMLLFPLPPSYVLVFLVAAIGVQTRSLFQCLKKNHIAISPTLRGPVLKTIMRSSLPMGIGVVFVWGYDKLDILLIQHLVNAEAVSYYSVAYSIYKLPQILSGVMLIPMFTELSGKYASRGSISLQEVRSPMLLLTGFSLMLMMILNLVPGILVSIVYGKTYESSGTLLAVLSFAIPGLFLNNFTGVMLNSIKQERKAMFSAFGALLVNIVINVVFLKRVGIMAAVIATVSAEYSILFVQCWYLKTSGCLDWKKP